MAINGKIDIIRRKNLPVSMKEDWKKARSVIKKFSKEQERSVKSIQNVIQGIFVQYRDNGFRNDKSLKLHRQFILLRNLSKKNGNFIQMLSNNKEKFQKIAEDVIEGISSEQTFDNIQKDDDIREVNKKYDTSSKYADDIVSIIDEMLEEIYENNKDEEKKSESEQKTKTGKTKKRNKNRKYQYKADENYEQDDIFNRKKDWFLKESGKNKKKSGSKGPGVFKGIQNLLKLITDTVYRTKKGKKLDKISSVKDAGSLITGTSTKNIGGDKELKENKKQEKKNKSLMNSFGKDIITSQANQKKRDGEISKNLKDVKKKSDKISKNKTLGKIASALNPIALFTKLFSVFGIVGIATSTLKFAFNSVKFVVGSVWKITKKIVTSVFSAAKSVTKFVFNPTMLKMIFTPTGMFFAGMLYGWFQNKFEKYKQELGNVVTSIQNVFFGVADKFKGLWPTLNMFYYKYTHGDFGIGSIDLIELLKGILESFKPSTILKKIGKRLCASAAGFLTWSVVKAALWGSAAATSATPVGWVLAAGALAVELGLIFWDMWTAEQRRRSQKAIKQKYHEAEAEKLEFRRDQETRNWDLSLFQQNRSYVRHRIGLFNPFKNSKLIQGGGIQPEDQDFFPSDWVDKLKESIEEYGNRNDISIEEKYSKFRGFFEHQYSFLKREETQILLIYSKLKDTNSDFSNSVTLDDFNDQVRHPSIDLFIGDEKKEYIDKKYSYPLQMRVMNLMNRMAILENMYKDGNLFGKFYKDGKSVLEEEYLSRSKSLFKIGSNGKLVHNFEKNAEKYTEQLTHGSKYQDENVSGSREEMTSYLDSSLSQINAGFKRYGGVVSSTPPNPPPDVSLAGSIKIEESQIARMTANIVLYPGQSKSRYENSSYLQIFKEFFENKYIKDELKKRKIIDIDKLEKDENRAKLDVTIQFLVNLKPIMESFRKMLKPTTYGGWFFGKSEKIGFYGDYDITNLEYVGTADIGQFIINSIQNDKLKKINDSAYAQTISLNNSTFIINIPKLSEYDLKLTSTKFNQFLIGWVNQYKNIQLKGSIFPPSDKRMFEEDFEVFGNLNEFSSDEAEVLVRDALERYYQSQKSLPTGISWQFTIRNQFITLNSKHKLKVSLQRFLDFSGETASNIVAYIGKDIPWSKSNIYAYDNENKTYVFIKRIYGTRRDVNDLSFNEQIRQRIIDIFIQMVSPFLTTLNQNIDKIEGREPSIADSIGGTLSQDAKLLGQKLLNLPGNLFKSFQETNENLSDDQIKSKVESTKKRIEQRKKEIETKEKEIKDNKTKLTGVKTLAENKSKQFERAYSEFLSGKRHAGNIGYASIPDERKYEETAREKLYERFRSTRNMAYVC